MAGPVLEAFSFLSQPNRPLLFLSANPSLRFFLLHGYLDIWVKEARNLPNMDVIHKTLGDVFSKLSFKSSKKGSDDGNRPSKGTCDPYVTISVSGAVIGRTFVIDNDENPKWMQHLNVPVAHYGAELHFVVKDHDVVGSQSMGVVAIPVEQLYPGALVEGTYPILNNSGKPCKHGALLSLSIRYIPAEQAAIFRGGMYASSDHQGVSGTYFPLRKGGKLTLYQDAHVEEGCLPTDFGLHGGVEYEHRSCWGDISESISQARRLIYITGWSVCHNVILVRNGEHKECMLGDLLKAKSQEGVRVLLLVWDLHVDGMMHTNDEETRHFFKHSSVQVILCPRYGGKGHSWIRKQEAGTIYSHHQKTVIVDADAGHQKRKIVAFVGGLDLCDGRYDTPGHPLFKTLQTTHMNDFYNPNFKGPTTGCPRVPWHDLHSKIDGPAAYDVLTNFEERWLRASEPNVLRRLKKVHEDVLLKIENIPEILGMDDATRLCNNDPEGWNIQIFRSIDSNSVKGFPDNPKDAISRNLVCGKNVMIDMSIHSAYVSAIRSAQRFIYIENQYFHGSSYNWSCHKNMGANNLIPMEIALKIVEKIKAKERFSAYVVIPMWPEGVPSSTPVQRILFWQSRTMQMMYEMIYRALEEVGLHTTYEPQDYLNFFCLGNREVVSDRDGAGNREKNAKVRVDALCSPLFPMQSHVCKSRRFMIYVHSKGMIVDDEYVILGSANINERSLGGNRDTEIAMGAYQPHHTWSSRECSSPRGQVYGYRMSLWAEHTGTTEECFERPESIECVRRIRSLGVRNWRQYVAEEVTEMRSHLLKYPLQVDPTGKVTHLPGLETFPDLGGNILGTPDLGGNILGTVIPIKENITI